MRAAFKTTLLLLHLLTGLVLAAVVAIDKDRRWPRERLASAWSRRLLRILDIRVRVRGTSSNRPRMTVANHVSWLDISVISSLEQTRFISKSEVRHWPVAGWLAVAAGAFYIRRGSGGAAPLIQELIPHLRAGGSVTLFPEGTTTDGSEVRDFHPRLFSAAIEAQIVTQPVALVYATGSEGAALAPFVGEDSMVSHILRLLDSDGLDVEVTYFAPLTAEGHTRESLAQAACELIRERVSAAGELSVPDCLGQEEPVFL